MQPSSSSRRGVLTCLTTIAIFVSFGSVLGQELGRSPSVGGVRVLSVRVGWPAHGAGLEPGDVITRFDNQVLKSENQYHEILRQAERLQRSVILTIVDVRSGNEVTRELSPSPKDG